MPSPPPHPVLHHLQRFLFLQKRKVTGPILLAVSGGPDSVCLLHAMTQLVDKNTLHIAHYNHRLRGEAGDADAAYVQSLCQQYSLHFHLGQSDQLHPQQTGIESRARQLRYQWLTETAHRTDCKWVMTGHTMNDQAETVLHHLIRGTGWRGLRGIAPVRLLPGGERGARLLRPLLQCAREDILNYLRSNHLTPRHDASNDDLRFTRNRIRHQIMPPLMTMNPHVVNHLASWADVARSHYAVLQQGVRNALQRAVVHQSPHQLALNAKEFLFLNDEFLQEMLHACWRKQHWPVDQMNARRWLEVLEVCHGKRTAVELPGRIMVRLKHLVIQITKPEQ